VLELAHDRLHLTVGELAHQGDHGGLFSLSPSMRSLLSAANPRAAPVPSLPDIMSNDSLAVKFNSLEEVNQHGTALGLISIAIAGLILSGVLVAGELAPSGGQSCVSRVRERNPLTRNPLARISVSPRDRSSQFLILIAGFVTLDP
jgi:hypothetical protein